MTLAQTKKTMKRIDLIKKIALQKKANKATKNYLKIIRVKEEDSFLCQNPKIEWAKQA